MHLLENIGYTVQNFKKSTTLFLCSQRLIFTRYPQIFGQNKSEAREPEGLVNLSQAPFLKEREIQIRIFFLAVVTS